MLENYNVECNSVIFLSFPRYMRSKERQGKDTDANAARLEIEMVSFFICCNYNVQQKLLRNDQP